MSCRNCTCCKSTGYKAVAERLRELAAYATLVSNGTLTYSTSQLIGVMTGPAFLAGPNGIGSYASNYLPLGSGSGQMSALIGGSNGVSWNNASACVRLPCGTVRPLKIGSGSMSIIGSTDLECYCLLALQLDDLASEFETVC